MGWKKRLVFWGGFFGLLALAYYWQPQRYEVFPPTVPESPRVNPAAFGLFEPGARVLVVTGHPDDSEFYLGGTLLRLAESGAVIRLVAMTDGDKAYYPFGVEAGLTETRREEQRRAAQVWNGDVVFLGFMDGRLPVSDETVESLRQQIQAFGPDFVLAQDPLYRPRTTHSDHIDAGRNALRAVERWGRPCKVLLFNTRAPNCYVDVQKYWFGKLDLLAIHESQFHGDRLLRISSYLADRALRDGEAAGQGMSESFRYVL